MFSLIRRWRRRRLCKKPFPSEWLPYLERHVPFFLRLPGELREAFLDRVKVFAWEKVFTGAGGLQITDEMRVVISALAARLILHLSMDCYDQLSEIVVYPYHYKHPEDDGMILGEAHTFGVMVLSWPAVLESLQDPRDGINTAIHEFAHVLDVADGKFDGAPELRAGEDYRAWAQILNRRYEALRSGKPDERKVLRDYGAENPAEFFAVATEAFFEKPREMKQYTPDLYAELQRFYGFDPASDDLDGVPSGKKLGRDEACPCGSGRKYNKCCGVLLG